jgi:CheY-like chemotaxis protein
VEASVDGQRVLVVEDEPALRDVLHALLTDEGYAARAATDGADALAQLRAWRPGLILLDLMMPGMDGWSFRRAQLADLRIASIPVVILTATYASWVEAKKLGVAGLLAKPYDFDALLTLIERLLGPVRSLG